LIYVLFRTRNKLPIDYKYIKNKAKSSHITLNVKRVEGLLRSNGIYAEKISCRLGGQFKCRKNVGINRVVASKNS